eukprot:3641836-Rhodomonas_salina.2
MKHSSRTRTHKDINDTGAQSLDSTLTQRLDTTLVPEAWTRHSLIDSIQHSCSKLRLDTHSLT